MLLVLQGLNQYADCRTVIVVRLGSSARNEQQTVAIGHSLHDTCWHNRLSLEFGKGLSSKQS